MSARFRLCLHTGDANLGAGVAAALLYDEDEWLELALVDGPHAEVALALGLAFFLHLSTREGALSWLGRYLASLVSGPVGHSARLLGWVISTTCATGPAMRFEPAQDELYAAHMNRLARQLLGVRAPIGRELPTLADIPALRSEPSAVATRLLDALRESPTFVAGNRMLDGLEALRTAAAAIGATAS